MTVTRRTASSFSDRAYTGSTFGPDHYWVQVPTAAQVGDLLHAVIRITGNAAGGIPALPGWTIQTILNAATGGGQLRVISVRRICQAGDPGTVFDSNIYAGNAVGDHDVVCSAYVGADTVSPIAFAGGYASNYIDCPAVPAVRAGSLVLDETIASQGIGSGTATVPAGDTLVYDESTTRHILALNSAGPSGLAARAWGIDPGYGPLNLAASTTVVLQPPDSAPAVPGAFTSPTTGQIVDASVYVAWGSSTDPDPGDTVTYSLDFTRDNGATWGSVATGLTSPAYTHNVTAVASSTACIYRVKAVDQLGVASGYRTSPTFIIDHNVAPNPATGLNPDGATLDRTSTNRLSWDFNDPNIGDTQTAADVRYRLTGAPTWTTIPNASTTNRWYDLAGFLLAAGVYEWQVLPYDSQGVPATGWSASAFITMATPPTAPTSLIPINGSTIPTSSGVLAWVTPSQTAYRVRVLADNAGAPADPTAPANVIYDSGDVTGPTGATARNHPLSYPTNNAYRHLQVQRKWGGLWSPWASVRVLVSYTPPPVPMLLVLPDPATASIGLVVVNPAPAGTEPVVTVNDELWVREAGHPETAYQRRDPRTEAAVAVLPNGSWTDRSPASDVAYEYRVRAFGVNGTATYSDWTG